MGFSLVAEGLLAAYLPASSWTPLMSKLGYSVGFLIVVLGRQQLYTETTLTAVLPFSHNETGQRPHVHSAAHCAYGLLFSLLTL